MRSCRILVIEMGFNFNRMAAVLCLLVVILNWGLGEVRADSSHDNKTIFRDRADMILVENDNSSESALTLRTQRVDPLDDLRKYEGGYNITNRHYWSSTIFTGKFGYIVAAAWIVSGLIYTIVLLIIAICFNTKRRRENKRPSFSRKYSIWPIVLGIVFTLLAIVASGVALGGSTRFHSRVRVIKNIVVKAADDASGTIYSVTEAVMAMQNDTQLYSSIGGSSNLNATTRRLNAEADHIKSKAESTMHRLNVGLKILNVVTIVIVSLNLVAILALLATRPLPRLRRLFHLLLLLCWVMTFLFWLCFGLYYFLNKFAGDTCAALDEYRQDPRNSTLSSILPCNDQASATTVLHEVGSGIHGLIDQVNKNISSFQSSLPGLEYVCNPFSGPPNYNYQPENCSSNTIQIGEIPQILKMYTCSNESSCKEGQFISANNYNRAMVYTSSIQSILNAYPGMESLVNCQLVKDAFSDVLFNDCKPLKKYVHMSWAAFATLSAIMVVLVLIWTIEAHRDGGRRSSDGSVKPHSTPTETSDVEMAEEVSVEKVGVQLER